MELNEVLNTIWQIVVIPLLGVLTAYAIKWINAQADELKAVTDNEYADKYITMLNDTITSTVIAVNQTYVDALKKEDAFTKEAQVQAFNKVYEVVLNSLTTEAYNYLNSIVADLNAYITNKIEEQVRLNKITK